MTGSKYAKYICTEIKPEAREIDSNRQGIDRMAKYAMYMDSEVIPGAMYSECVWLSPGYLAPPEDMRKYDGLPAHTHSFDEVICYFGTSLDDPYDLGGETELWLEDEKFDLRSSFMVFAPAGMRHGPIRHITQDRRMFHFTLSPSKKYVRETAGGETPVKKDWDVRKHVITGLKEDIARAPWSAGPKQAGSGRGGRLFYMDSEVIPGAFYAEVVWVTPLSEGSTEKTFPGGDPVEPHSHDFDEVIAFFGTDPDNIRDLCGEVELWLEDEKFTLTETCMVYVPAGLRHCPLRFHRVDRPILYFTAGPGEMYF